MRHSFYEADTNILRFWNPALQSYSVKVLFTLTLPFPLFDESSGIPRGADSASHVNRPTGRRGSAKLRFDYTQSENGIHEGSWSKSKTFFVSVDLAFNLTRNTTVTYSQRYDFESDRTINSSVGIVRNIHCWTGSLQWTPTGSNKGFAFKLYVTKLPEIKIDQGGHDSFLEGIQSRYY
jgi:hypothetical protein